jgi:hypothetical protein
LNPLFQPSCSEIFAKWLKPKLLITQNEKADFLVIFLYFYLW